MHFMAETIAQLNYIQFINWYSCRKRVRLYQMGHNIQVFCWIFIKYQCNLTETFDGMTALSVTYFVANGSCQAFRKWSCALFHTNCTWLRAMRLSNTLWIRNITSGIVLSMQERRKKNQFYAHSIKFYTKIVVGWYREILIRHCLT